MHAHTQTPTISKDTTETEGTPSPNNTNTFSTSPTHPSPPVALTSDAWIFTLDGNEQREALTKLIVRGDDNGIFLQFFFERSCEPAQDAVLRGDRGGVAANRNPRVSLARQSNTTKRS